MIITKVIKFEGPSKPTFSPKISGAKTDLDSKFNFSLHLSIFKGEWDFDPAKLK